MVTLAKGKQNVSACIFDVVMSCACALEPRIYNDCGNWSGPSTGLDPTRSSSKLLALSARTKWYSIQWAWLQ